MRYFFIPGRLKDLSWEELTSVCKTFFSEHQYKLTREENFYILDIDLNIDHIFPRLGGFMKYGVLLDHNFQVNDLIQEKDKIIFGISSYSPTYNSRQIQDLSRKLKQELTKEGVKPRFILPKRGTFLNTAQILKNNILENGFELVVLGDQFGKTISVQDMDGFSSREYDKPFVDTQMGVLPLKLARIMVNLAEISPGGNLWDPFCGSGNILLEGLDLGYNVLGSDIDEDALSGTKTNISWLKKSSDSQNFNQIFFLDVLQPTKSKINILKDAGVGGVVCEPYMGEAQRRKLEVEKANRLIKQHFKLVKGMFDTINMLNLQHSMRVVVVFPEYKTNKGWKSIEKSLLNFKNARLLKTKDLHWSRRDSIIRRLIFIFEYSSR